MKKRILSLLLILALTLSLSSAALAGGSSAAATGKADALRTLGLFQGTDRGYELDAAPTRIQGLVMLIRLLGEEQAALACTWENPFADIPGDNWADRYAAYGLHMGYATGRSATAFDPNGGLDAKSYFTFLLRALGYDDAAGEFSWSTAPDFAVTVGLTDPSSADALRTAALNRGDLVEMSFAALTMPLAKGGGTLAEKLIAAGVFTAQAAKTAGVTGARVVYSYVPYDSSTVSLTQKSYALPSGTVKADVLTVNLNNPRVSVRSAMVNNTLGATAPFASIVAASGALAVVNANYFQSYQDFKTPIGHVVCGGEFLSGVTGLTAFALTSDNRVRVGKPAFFFRVSGDSGNSWSCYEVNSTVQGGDNSILFTPAYGPSVTLTAAGTVVTVKDGAITAVSSLSPGESAPIPAGGFLLWLSAGYTATDYYRAPTVGERVTMEPYLFKADEEGFVWDSSIVSLVSGSPRLVKDGASCTQLDPGFTEARFPTSSTPRTAIGVLPDGKLLLVSTGAATVQLMRELMLALGCEDAMCLDGGGSTALYYNGRTLRSPGRELTTTLQVFVS